MTPLRRKLGPTWGPVVISLAAGVAALLSGLLVNGCQLSKLLGRPSAGESRGAIIVVPPEVVDSALAGTAEPRVANLAVTNSGTWFATTGSSWIHVSPTRGGARATLRLSLDPSQLTPGMHVGVVTLQEHDSAGPTASVTVNFRIQQPILSVKPASITHTPHSSSDVFLDTLEIQNTGDGPLVWSATTEHQARWLTLTNASGNGDGKIAVRSTNAGLAYFGTYKETIIVTAPGAKDSPKRINVTMERRKHGHDDVPTP